MRLWTPVLFQLQLRRQNRRMLPDAHVVSAPSDLWLNICLRQPK